MNETDVTRDGLQGGRPGREALVWSDGGKPARGDRPPRREPTSSSYYGQPIINQPVWEEREIAGYLFTGGLAGASAVLAAGARLTGRATLARRTSACASVAISVSLAALIKDLGRPERFINMLRVVKPSSPMNIGTWVLSGFTPLNYAATLSMLSGRSRLLGAGAAVGAGGLGPVVATYTAALIANTAVPAWHDGHREMPFLFAGSAASAAGGFGLIAAPLLEQRPARRMAVVGAVGELAAEQLLERRLGMVAETLHSGSAGERLRVAKALTVGGTALALLGARRSRLAAAASGAALLAGSAFTRFGLFAAGMASASDPKYTVEPQRARLRQGS